MHSANTHSRPRDGFLSSTALAICPTCRRPFTNEEEARRVHDVLERQRHDDVEKGKALGEAKFQEEREALQATIDARVGAERAQWETQAANERTLLNQRTEVALRRVHALERALEEKTANHKGEHGEVNLVEMLKVFKEHRIIRVPKGQNGADVHLEVWYKGKFCGLMVLDYKNVVQWLDRYAVKLRQDRLDAGGSYAVCVTPAFPSGSQHIAIHENGTILVEPDCVVALVRVLCHAMIAAAMLREAGKDGKADKVLALCTTGDGQAKLQAALEAIPKVRALDQGLVRAAKKHLDDSEKVLKLQEQNLGDVYHSIDAIIAGDDAA